MTLGSTSSNNANANNGIVDAVVIGSGLAGLTAALEILDRGGRVVIVEKESSLGGNSIKASSGINGCVSQDEEIDSFVKDTIQSAGDRANPKLIQTMVEHSSGSLQWLNDRLDVNLESKSQLGGHDRPRTHRPTKGTIGYSLISALKRELEKFCGENGSLKIMTSTKAKELIQEDDDSSLSPGSISGVKVFQRRDTDEQEVEVSINAKNVILATGGFAAARNKDSILKKYAPHLVHMPATVGSFSTGDGIHIALSAGADTVDMDQIQIHPTGFVDPKDPQNPSKILCAEVMRGVGGILLNGGKRFCNELGPRDYVVSKMMECTKEKKDSSFFILLPSNAAKKAEAHVGFYTWKGLLKKVTGFKNVAEYMETDSNTLRDTLLKYRVDAKAGRDDFGKSFFPDHFDNDIEMEEYEVGCITPVLHYCMGGISINTSGNVLNNKQEVIPGLWAAGEVSGGVHGCNRLAGNSLLECLVYGRIIGREIPLQ